MLRSTLVHYGNMNDSTPKRLKNEYLDEFGKLTEKTKEQRKIKDMVEFHILTMKEKRPLLLGEQLDAAVQETWNR